MGLLGRAFGTQRDACERRERRQTGARVPTRLLRVRRRSHQAASDSSASSARHLVSLCLNGLACSLSRTARSLPGSISTADSRASTAAPVAAGATETAAHSRDGVRVVRALSAPRTQSSPSYTIGIAWSGGSRFRAASGSRDEAAARSPTDTQITREAKHVQPARRSPSVGTAS